MHLQGNVKAPTSWLLFSIRYFTMSSSSVDIPLKRKRAKTDVDTPESEWQHIVVSHPSIAAVLMNYAFHEMTVEPVESGATLPVIVSEKYSKLATVGSHERSRWVQSLPFALKVRVTSKAAGVFTFERVKSRQSESDISDSASLHSAVSEGQALGAKDVIDSIVHGLSEDDDEDICALLLQADGRPSTNCMSCLSPSNTWPLPTGSDKLCTFSPRKGR